MKRLRKLTDKLPANMATLKMRLNILITVVLLLVVGGPVFFLLYQLDKYRTDFTVNMIETTTQAVYQSIFHDMLKNNHNAIQQKLEVMALTPQIQLIRVYSPSGKIIFSSHQEEIGKNVFMDSTHDFINPHAQTPQETFIKVKDFYSHHHPIVLQKECTPCHHAPDGIIGMLDVHVLLSGSDAFYSSIERFALFGAIFIIVLLWIIINFLYEGQIEARLRKILRGFQELAQGNFNFKIDMPGRHELAMLADKFNETVQKLKESREREERLMQDKLARADRLVTLGEVAAEIAHEVNNPAGIILTRAEFLRDELSELPNCTEIVEDVDIIIQQTERIANTTQSILHYARKFPQDFSDIELSRVIRQSLKIMEPRIRKSNVAVYFNPPIRSFHIRGNPIQLEQIFCNLINNSLDVLPPRKGEIHIDIQSNPLDNGREDIRIIISDNGPGIPKVNRDKIFSPFFTTKPDGKGTGLGLFIVRNLLRLHHGDIQLANSDGPGATFIITLGATNEKIANLSR